MNVYTTCFLFMQQKQIITILTANLYAAHYHYDIISTDCIYSTANTKLRHIADFVTIPIALGTKFGNVYCILKKK